MDVKRTALNRTYTKLAITISWALENMTEKICLIIYPRNFKEVSLSCQYYHMLRWMMVKATISHDKSEILLPPLFAKMN